MDRPQFSPLPPSEEKEGEATATQGGESSLPALALNSAPLKTSDLYEVKNIPERFNHPEWFEGYNVKSQHPFYSPSSAVYGSKGPSVHTMPTKFHGRSQKFTKDLGKFGMYRNHSLNTAPDHSRV